MTNFLSRFMKDESGATAIEYGLIAAIVSVGIIGALGTLRTSLQDIFGTVGTELDNAGTSTGTTP